MTKRQSLIHFINMCVVGLAAHGCVGKERPFGVGAEGADPGTGSVTSDAGAADPSSDEDGVVPTGVEPGTPIAPEPADCTPGTRRCAADGAVQFCDDDGAWQNEAPCPIEQSTCASGVCSLCSPGSRQCGVEGVPQECASDGAAWLTGAACAGDRPFCVPETGQCGECSPGDVRTCVGALGNCAAGQQLCSPQATWDACSIQPQAADTCSPGDDASCDGNPNGGCRCMGDVSCGPVAEVGICRFGVSSCVDGVPGACQGAVLPGVRDCTSPFDNDCDGVPDDNLDDICECQLGDQEACDPHPGQDGQGICRAGTRTCVASAGNLATRWGSCQGSVGPRARDCRSALDNDCNGLPDNALDATCECVPGSQRSCSPQSGSFGCAAGTQTCEAANGGAQSRWGACRNVPVANGTTCSDENALTFADSCQDGTCEGFDWGTVAVGNGGLCAIRSGGVVWCWDGVGFGGILNQPEAVSLPGPARSVSVGARQACAVLEDGVPFCWGSNDAGQLGTGNLEPAPVTAPARIQNLSTARMLVAGAEGTTALDGAGAPFVWGTPPGAIFLRSDFGFSSTTPVQTTTLSSALMLALGSRHACVLLPSGEVSCWGQNEFLQRGSGARSSTVAFSPLPTLNDAVLIDAGQTSTCVVRETGNVSCWGAFGCAAAQCGTEPTNVPSLVDARQVSVGGDTACALRATGTVVCWGRLDLPPVGGLEDVAQPAAVPNLNDAILLAATDEIDGHCALRRNGGIVCWDETIDIEPVTTLPD
jgi:alpha-tubulin suppressor-like RCC1 family protein